MASGWGSLTPHYSLLTIYHSPPSHRRSDRPRNELRIAIAELLGFRVLARGDSEHLLEDLAPLLEHRHAFDDVAAIDVHVVDHAAIHFGIGGELDRRRRLAAIGRAAPGGEG